MLVGLHPELGSVPWWLLGCPFMSVAQWGEEAHLCYEAPVHHPSLCPCTQRDDPHPSVAWDEAL